MIKYEIIKNGMDDYTLKYKDQQVRFCSKVGIVSELQNVNKQARLLMVADLKKQGLTTKDLINEVKDGANTLYDNSDLTFIEEGYIKDLQSEIFLKALEEMLGISFETLLKELEVKTESESQELAIKLGECLIPSNERTR